MPNFGNKGGRKGNLPAVPGSGGAVAVPGEIVAPNCKVCRSPYRREVDMLLATGWGQIDVVRHMNDTYDAGFTKDGMNRHRNRHLSLQDAAVRKIFEARAQKIMDDVDEIEGFIITKEAVLDALVHEGLMSVRRGTVSVEARDVITAIQMLAKFEEEYKETALDEIMLEFQMFTAAVKEVVGEEMYDAIMAVFERNIENNRRRVLKKELPQPAVTSETMTVEYEDTDEPSR